MLATFVIGLREGLEAVLIVSIIAAFLKRNGIARWPMWCGVSLAVLISIGVGVTLQVIEQSLPQAKQEGMESIIGLVAVVFVTGMIVWMGKNARGLKSEIEQSAGAAVSEGTAWALAGMAFLAVVKEGFETAVFLLATLNASTSATAAAFGAVIGIVVSCVAGYILYMGGARLNLAKFFKISGVFLVLVAGGLLLTAFRRAHGAGWINIGQQRTVDLSWLSPIGSVRSALITGVLGIPADPRVIEVLAWFCFVIPVLTLALWPPRWRPAPAVVPVVKVALAGAAALAATTMALTIPSGGPNVPTTASLTAGRGNPDRGPITAEATVHGNSVSLLVRGGDHAQTITFPASSRTVTRHMGIAAAQWTARTAPGTDRPSTLTIDQLATLFGRIPVGISTVQDPGPYHAAWTTSTTNTLWLAHGGILDVHRTDRVTLTLTGGGLTHARTLTLTEPYWSVPNSAVTATSDQVSTAELAAQDRALWRVWLPIALGAAAVALALGAWRSRRLLARSGSPATQRGPVRPDPTETDGTVPDRSLRSDTHALQ